MPVRDTSLVVFEKKKELDRLGHDQDAVLSILEEIGPADDLRILEALNQKEATTYKSKAARRIWTINCITPRRGELVMMGLVCDMGRFKHPDRCMAVHLWRITGDNREPLDWMPAEQKTEIKNQNLKLKEQTGFSFA